MKTLFYVKCMKKLTEVQKETALKNKSQNMGSGSTGFPLYSIPHELKIFQEKYFFLEYFINNYIYIILNSGNEI